MEAITKQRVQSGSAKSTDMMSRDRFLSKPELDMHASMSSTSMTTSTSPYSHPGNRRAILTARQGELIRGGHYVSDSEDVVA